jgi:glyoxylase-like metal-dependent hydrolase (beta-lactamase superfamily II)
LAKRIQATFPNWKNVKQAEVRKEVIPGVRAIETYGHTPGHTSYQLGSGRRQLIVLGDVTNIPALFVKNPGWHAAFDSDPNMAEQNRRKIFDRIVADKATVTGYHFGLPGAGTIKKDGKGYAFVPVKAT